ncbi:MAG: septal ring lytic transglycosylase RlpA family protein [Rhizobiaceae bacterium]
MKRYLVNAFGPRGLKRVACVSALAFVAASCASPQPKVGVGKSKSKEYFSEKEYGVKASPRTSIKRGGGRYQVGKPYKVKGQWYYPKEVRSYSKVGKASWYGSAFHGRLTANGEVYDMTHLTAAHPTLPLPSYARVTNLENGSSVIVRVNDRGPFAHGRIIDLSKRAAEMLDYTHTGIAKVKVDYVGPAPLHGQDDSYLMASYRPSGRAPDPSDGLATGVLVAMNGPTPENGGRRKPVFPGAGLPDAGPILADRPDAVVARLDPGRLQALAYAGGGVSQAGAALDKLVAGGLSSGDIIGSWKRQAQSAGRADAVLAGTFASRKQADAIAAMLRYRARVEIETSYDRGSEWHTVTAWPTKGVSADDLVAGAWAAGASDAMILRD